MMHLAFGPTAPAWTPPLCCRCGALSHRVGTDPEGRPTYGCGPCLCGLWPLRAARLASVPAPSLRLLQPLNPAA